MLTAAHCILTKLKYFVRLAEHDITDEDTTHKDVPVIRSARHSYYDFYVNDIGMLYLEHDVEFTGRNNFSMFRAIVEKILQIPI